MGNATIVGRAGELDVLRHAVDDVTAGIGSRLIVGGDPGIGKTCLLRAATDHAGGRGVAVAARIAFESDRALPWLTLGAALRGCAPSGEAFGWLREEPRSSYALLGRLTESLEEFVAGQPLVVAIDDAQWMDESSAVAIRELVPALESAPVCWLFGHRPVPGETPGQLLVSWLRQTGATTLALAPLADHDVAELCADRLGHPVDHTVLALAAGFRGVPLLVEQLVRALRATGQVVVTDGVAGVVGNQLPASFVAVVDQLLAGLSPDTGRLVRNGAVFARPFGVDAVASLLDLPVARTIPRVEEATAAGVLVDGAGGLTFSHDLLRRAVYAGLSPAVRPSLHRRAAAVLRAEGAPPAEVAGHLLRAGPSGAARAGTLLRRAAAEVAGAAPSTAADLILRALEVRRPGDAGRDRLVAEAVELLAAAGRIGEAQELARTVSGGGLPPTTRAVLRLGLAEAAAHAGLDDTAVHHAGRGLVDTGDDPEPSDVDQRSRGADGPAGIRAKLLAVRAHGLVHRGDLAAADEAGRLADEAGRGAGTTEASASGLSARRLVALAEGRLTDAHRYALAATEVTGSGAHPRIGLADTLRALGRHRDADRELRQAWEDAERRGTTRAAPRWHHVAARLHLAQGRVDDAAAEADAGLTVAGRSGAGRLTVPLLGMLARLAVARDDPDAAGRHLEQLRARRADGTSAAPEDADWSEAVVLAARGDPAAALAAVRGLVDRLPDRPALFVHDPTSAVALVRIALEAGDRVRARGVVRAAGRLAARNPRVPSIAAAAAHAEGVLRRDLTTLRRAVERYRPTGQWLALATALEDAGATADRATATAWFEEALTITTTCGARAHQRRLEQRLRGRPTRVPAGTGPELRRLSPKEFAVALLVADGLTNHQVGSRLHISSHTVDSHLRNIFRKLEIRSRVDLTRLVAGGNGVDPVIT
ncbi:ATP-binding protein [Cryptosporangium japonicum]|uniref:HTH luxR-type domain-containing protein n=1 Tax=Cryptosporangium japonicum TaxID=80872 RepID=A0ABP3E667_9ACTN